MNTPAHRYVPSRSRDSVAIRQIRARAITNSAEQHAAPDEPELLADRGEREVGPHHRHVALVGEVALRASPSPTYHPVPTARIALRTW